MQFFLIFYRGNGVPVFGIQTYMEVKSASFKLCKIVDARDLSTVQIIFEIQSFIVFFNEIPGNLDSSHSRILHFPSFSQGIHCTSSISVTFVHSLIMAALGNMVGG